jgi:hypothetical protein
MGKLSENALFKSITVAFLILIMHVLLIGGVGILVLLVSGIINHTAWFLVGIALLAVGAFMLYKRIKVDSKKLKEAVGDLRDRNVEISLLGGVATMKISSSNTDINTGQITFDRTRLLTSPASGNIQKLTELSRLYEKELLTREEYETAKKKLFSDKDKG